MKTGRPVTIAILTRNRGPATDMMNHDITWVANWLENSLIAQNVKFLHPFTATPMDLVGKNEPDYISMFPGRGGISKHWYKTVREYQKAIQNNWSFFVPGDRGAEIWDIKDTHPYPLHWNLYSGTTYPDDVYKKIISEQFSKGFVSYVGLLHKKKLREEFMERMRRKEKLFYDYKEVSCEQITTHSTMAELDKPSPGPDEAFVSERIVWQVFSPFFMTKRDQAFLDNPPQTSSYARQVLIAVRRAIWNEFQDFTQALYQVTFRPKYCNVLRPIFPPKNWRSAPTYY